MRTLNGKILINDKGELNEQVWLENCIAVGELLAKRSKTMNDDTIERFVVAGRCSRMEEKAATAKTTPPMIGKGGNSDGYNDDIL